MNPLRLLAAMILSLGACGPIPGGKLTGHATPVPADWHDILTDRTICEIQSRPANPHSIQLECFLHNNELHVQSHRWVNASWWPTLSWATIWQEEPAVKVRIDDKIFAVNAMVVDTAREQILFERGYDPIPEGIVIFKFLPEIATSTDEEAALN